MTGENKNAIIASNEVAAMTDDILAVFAKHMPGKIYKEDIFKMIAALSCTRHFLEKQLKEKLGVSVKSMEVIEMDKIKTQ